MSDRAQKKHRKEQKRKQKQLARRRAESVSPFRRIAQTGQIEACYINSNWQEEGIASIQFIRDTPTGLALAAFLVDVWCIGLKDAFGSVNLLREDVDMNLDRARRQFPLTRVEPDIARSLLASAIRFSKQNGFRLPRHYERYVAVAGGVGEVESADISQFGKDGKLFYVGRLQDLSSRLMTCTVDEFARRPDVDVTIIEGAGTFGSWNDDDELDDDDGELDEDDDDFGDGEVDYFDLYRSIVEAAPPKLATTFRQQLLERGEPAHPRLEDGIKLVFAKMLAEQAPPGKLDDDDIRALAARTMSTLAAAELLSPDDKEIPADLRDACLQASKLLNEMYDNFDRAMSSGDRMRAMLDVH